MELPPRKRVKVEQEAEEVSTVVSGKVVVSAMGSARIVGRNQTASEQETGHKLLAKTRTDSACKKDAAVQKKKSSSARSDLRKSSSVKQDKATKLQEESVCKAAKSSKPPKSLKRSGLQQAPKKKKRSV